ncbi:hydrogenase maturation nickel metallochaperone HypA/HybF [Goodfellowiella coeruleoviolacea]|uniref:Hydrogenase maturation factor HypA n=1 Tax=Goodfellowiella coeruleoviolacea TaxID=334858 RepID=A0AAE3G9R7_9PSEU|nr:hydrogenase maturation nickel metallochaperone HypA [Goodfellowiella coeruleoviolacea]MCP2163494.1 hydrogenase nickel incorporation protein HypA/HybF [Goodfellowiella coeruleoviolacea]
MHELAITQDIVHAITERVAGARVTAVRLEVGRLSGVLAHSVRFCFELVCRGTGLEGASLEITEPGGRARCHDCADEFDLADPILLCPCGSANVSVLSGRQLRITSVEVC